MLKEELLSFHSVFSHLPPSLTFCGFSISFLHLIFPRPGNPNILIFSNYYPMFSLFTFCGFCSSQSPKITWTSCKWVGEPLFFSMDLVHFLLNQDRRKKLPLRILTFLPNVESLFDGCWYILRWETSNEMLSLSAWLFRYWVGRLFSAVTFKMTLPSFRNAHSMLEASLCKDTTNTNIIKKNVESMMTTTQQTFLLYIIIIVRCISKDRNG